MPGAEDELLDTIQFVQRTMSLAESFISGEVDMDALGDYMEKHEAA